MSTTVADLPKDLLIAEGLKGELLKEHNLKPTEATEKNVLPSAEDVQQEKTHQNILTGKLQKKENDCIRRCAQTSAGAPNYADYVF
jgi:hypothetical protein